MSSLVEIRKGASNEVGTSSCLPLSLCFSVCLSTDCDCRVIRKHICDWERGTFISFRHFRSPSLLFLGDLNLKDSLFGMPHTPLAFDVALPPAESVTKF